MGRRAWGFEERLAEERGSELARRCWKEMRERIKKGAKLSKWEKKRKEFFEKRGRGMIEVEERKEEKFDFREIEEKDREEQRKERWNKILGSRYNKWYRKVKGEGISGIFEKGMGGE